MNNKYRINRYLNDEMDENQRRETEDWIAENEDSSELDNILLSELDNTKIDPNIDIQSAFREFRKGVKRHSAFVVRFASTIKWTQRIAAIMMLPLIISTLYLINNSKEVEWQEVYVARGEKQELTLPDGTQLWINSDSRITYPSTFKGENRQIFVDGEIFASVAKDKRHPFIISSDQVDIEVLGTQFNFRSYNEDNKAEVALTEGSVKMSVGDIDNRQQIILKPSDLATYDKRSGTLSKTTFNIDSYTLTNQENRYFRNERLGDIAKQLSRQFNRRIVITDPALEDLTFYALITNQESLLEILNIFNSDNLLKIKEHNNSIYISKKY